MLFGDEPGTGWLLKKLTKLLADRRAPYMGAMQNLDLTEDETAALVALLTRTIDGDRYPLSPRARALKDILAEPARRVGPAR